MKLREISTLILVSGGLGELHSTVSRVIARQLRIEEATNSIKQGKSYISCIRAGINVVVDARISPARLIANHDILDSPRQCSPRHAIGCKRPWSIHPYFHPRHTTTHCLLFLPSPFHLFSFNLTIATVEHSLIDFFYLFVIAIFITNASHSLEASSFSIAQLLSF